MIFSFSRNRSLDNCIKCKTQMCMLCDPGYYSDPTDGKCYKCDDNCAICAYKSKGVSTCEVCKEGGYKVNSQGQCTPPECSSVQNCAVCESTKCATCNNGFGLDEAGLCVGCTDGCTRCSTKEDFDKLVEDYNLEAVSTETNATRFLQVPDDNGGSGTSSDDEYSDSSSSSDSDGDSMKCYECENGYYMKLKDGKYYVNQCKPCSVIIAYFLPFNQAAFILIRQTACNATLRSQNLASSATLATRLKMENA